MTTTNLTLSNGVTSDVAVQVTGITFEVDSKLSTAATFPITVAIDSSEVIGIDFDETLNTGDSTEQITINTLEGSYDITHTVNIVDTSGTSYYITTDGYYYVTTDGDYYVPLT